MTATGSTGTLYPSAYAAETPTRPAYTMCATGETVTYGEFEKRANQGAHLFRSLGLMPGDHIAVVMENNRQYLEVCFAADRSGLYYTTINTRLTEDDIGFIVTDCDAKIVITSSALLEKMPRLARIFRHVPNCYSVGGGPFDDWDKTIAPLPVSPIADERQGLDMLYSSGTTGRPKGIKWPLPDQPPGERIMMVDLLNSLFGYDRATRYLSPAPLYHAAPLRHCMTVLKMGGEVFIMDKFEAEDALARIERHRITHSQWVPTMFVRMLKLPPDTRQRYDLSSLKLAVHAAAPCPVPVKEQMIDWWGPIIHEYYAASENNGFCAITPEEWLAHKGSVGQSKHGVLHICNEEGEELPPGSVGTVYFSKGQEFSYHKQPEATAAARNRHGWTTVGDIGEVDADGYLYLRDRKAFVIISGGVNIYPQEIEDTLIAHPKVMDAAVFGLPNEDWGEEVKAVVQLLHGVDANDALAEELMIWCKSRMASFKCPRSIDFSATLPRHPTGKLYKRLLRDHYLERLATNGG